MVYLSRGALAMIVVFLTFSTGDARAGPSISLRQPMDPAHQGNSAASTVDMAARGEPDQPCVPATSSHKDQLEKDTCGAAVTDTTTTTGHAKRQDTVTKPYLISTVDGTSMDDFKTFAAQPPLGDKQGNIISFDDVPWISAQYLNLTDADADEVRKNPIIAFAEPILEDDGAARVIPAKDYYAPRLGKRALPQSLNQREESAYHLGLIAARNQKNDPTKLPNYVYEPSLGQGQTIYVLDGGYRKSHVEFDATGRVVRDFVVPNDFTLAPIQPPIDPSIWAPEDMTDVDGHGTAVASVAAGNSNGVASSANLVVVKFKNAAKNPNNPDNPNFIKRGVTDSALDVAFGWVISDVARQRRDNNNDPNAKFIINLSYGKQRTIYPVTSKHLG
jgi:hypothetical protein